jgi:membrane protein DedA with SNARE-associated domain
MFGCGKHWVLNFQASAFIRFGRGSGLQEVLQFLARFGVWGLFVATALAATSLPFPGAVFVIVYGYLLRADFWQLIGISAVNSAIYSLFSLIPFTIGAKFGKIIKRKWNPTKVEKAQAWFRRYGEWSIALGRPTGFGKTLSWLSGTCGVPVCRYLLLTFAGTFPWNVVLLYVGSLGNLAYVQAWMERMKVAGPFLAGGLIVLLVMVWFLRRAGQGGENDRK